VLDAFDDYWGGRPPIRRIRFVETPELASRIDGLLSGDFDFACDITPDQIAGIEAHPRTEVAGGVITNQRVLMMDTNHPQLRDVRVRQAMSHAIDRQTIIDTIWGGRTNPSHGLQFAFFGPMFLQDWTVPAYDPALARDLLRQAGYKGESIPYKLINNYYTNQVATAQILIEMWRAVGLNVDLQMRENWSQVQDASAGRGILDNSMTAFFNDPVSFMPDEFGTNGEFPADGYWSNADAMTLLTQLETSTDLAQRRALFRQILQIVERDDPAVLHLHETANFTGKRRDIRWKPAHSFVMDFRSRNFAIQSA
jgi:peptide/nickel transport system substrate-binding protein